MQILKKPRVKINNFTLLLIFSMTVYGQKAKDILFENSVNFPNVSGPIQLTYGPYEHFFASYYGINSFSADERYATVLRTEIKNHLPDENESATLGLVDLKTKSFIPLVQTSAWNFQQGCMAHWLSTNPDSLIIYNDLRQGKFVSIILNVHTKKEEKVIPFPISAVSPSGKEAVSINFSRLRETRDSYGYGGGGQNSKIDKAYPKDDGIFLVNLESGKAKLIVSLLEIKKYVPKIAENRVQYFNHTLFSRKGSKIFWLSRAKPIGKNTTAFTVNRNGTNLNPCFPEGWGGSHFDWLNDNEIMVTAKYKKQMYGHILFDTTKKDYRRLGKGLLDYDGHGTFSPDGKWMVTDTYPKNELMEQKIFLMEMESEAVISLGRFENNKIYEKDWRCDIHCRWSPSGNLIGFNSTHNGTRQIYVFKLNNE